MTSSEEVASLLGAGTDARSVPVVLFIPSRDRDGADVDQGYWAEEAIAVLGKLFGGATTLPAGRGSWMDERRRHLLHEDIVVIFSLVTEQQAVDVATLAELGAFLRRLGRETHQGEVAVVVDANLYKLNDFHDQDGR